MTLCFVVETPDDGAAAIQIEIIRWVKPVAIDASTYELCVCAQQSSVSFGSCVFHSVLTIADQEDQLKHTN